MPAETYSPDFFLSLEKSLFTPGHPEHLIAENFVEIGSSGKFYGRQDALEALNKDPGRDIEFTALSVLPIAPDVYLFCFRTVEKTEDKIKTALRSSLWKLEKGGWKVIFHQGTPGNS